MGRSSKQVSVRFEDLGLEGEARLHVDAPEVHVTELRLTSEQREWLQLMMGVIIDDCVNEGDSEKAEWARYVSGQL